MFLLKLSTLSAAIFLVVSLVLSLLCVHYIRMLCRHVCFVSNNVVADECDHVVLDKTALCMDTLCIQQKNDEPALCVQQIHVAKEIKFRSCYMMFVYHCNINNPEYHVRQLLISDIDKFILPCLLFDRPEILSNLNIVYESCHSLARHEYLQGGQQQFFIIVFFSIRYQTLISDIDTFLLALFIVS